MPRFTHSASEEKAPAPAPLAGGCATCWAAKYCAAFSALASPQPPPNCPLVPRPKPKSAHYLPAAR